MAKIIKIKIEKRSRRPLTPLQKKIVNAPVMSDEEYSEFKKINKWMKKWKT